MIKKEFKNLNVRLVLEDCVEFLQNLESSSIDLILIDPSYQVSRKTNFKSGDPKVDDRDRFRVSMEFGERDCNFDKLGLVVKESYRVLKNFETFICFYDVWKITELLELLSENKCNQIVSEGFEPKL